MSLLYDEAGQSCRAGDMHALTDWVSDGMRADFRCMHGDGARTRDESRGAHREASACFVSVV